MRWLLIAFIAVCGVLVVAAENKVVCYYGTWATYRNSRGKYEVNDVNPFLCTHLIYAFFGITESGDLRVIDPYLDLEDNWGRGNIKKFNALKELNPNLKTIAAVGGWNEGSTKFSNVAKDPAKIQRFAKSAREFILKHGFDGLDLDWEYPGQRDGDPSVDKQNHLLLLQALKAELSPYNLLLTAAVASAEFSAAISYDIPEIMKVLDFVNVMVYDLHGSWESFVGINAPLYAGPSDTTDVQRQLNVNASIHYWLSQGAPASKLILGLPLYGRTFTLHDAAKTAPGSPSTGVGLPGPYSNEPGMIGYNELCEKLKTDNWSVKWEDTQKVPYAVKGRQWVGYDDAQSVELKAKYANDLKLGGVMVWSVETDDFNGICGETYPLLKTINSIVRPEYDVPSSGERPTVPSAGATYKCTDEGIFRDPIDCSSYHICINGFSYNFKCPGGLLFDTAISGCNYPEVVDCQNNF